MQRLIKSFFFLLGITVFLYFFASYSLRLPQIQSAARHYLASKLSAVLARSVTIDHISGNIFTGIEMNNISISTEDASLNTYFVTIQEMTIFISPRFVIRDFSRLIKGVTITGFDINVIRSLEKKLNVQSFFKRISSGGDSRYRGQFHVEINDVTGQYIDLRGWHKTPKAFSTSFSAGKAAIHVDLDSGIQLSVQALPEGGNELASLTAQFVGQQFVYEFNINSLYTDYWSDYFIPFSKVKVRDDVIHVKGRLDSREKRHPGQLPYFFNIEIDFDYLTVQLPKFSSPLKNTSGTILFSNTSDTSLIFENTFAEFMGFPIEIKGALTLNKKTMDMHLFNLDPIPYTDLLDSSMLADDSLFKFNVMMDYYVKGPIRRPAESFKIALNDIQLNRYSIDPIVFKMIKKTGGVQFHSLNNSSIQFLGQFKPKKMSLSIQDVPFLRNTLNRNEPIQVDIDIQQTPKGFLVGAHNIVSFGFANFNIDSIESDIFLLKNKSVHLPSVNIHLSNGQTLIVDGAYDAQKSVFEFNQVGLTSLEENDQPQYLNEMNTVGRYTNEDGQWRSFIACDVVGKGALIKSQQIDEFDFAYRLDNAQHSVSINSLIINDGSLFGRVIFDKKELVYLDLTLSKLNLVAFSFLSPQIEELELKGMIDGHFQYQLKDMLNIEFSIENLSTIFGQLGSVSSSVNMDDALLSINKLNFSNLHQLSLVGSYRQASQQLNLVAKGDIKLEAFDFFNKFGIRADLNLDGTISGDQMVFGFDGMILSKKASFRGKDIDLFKFDGRVLPNRLDVANAELGFKGGTIQAVGEVDFVLDKTSFDFLISNYNLQLSFDQTDLNYLNQLYASLTDSFKSMSRYADFITPFRQYSYEYHKYQLDNLSLFNQSSQFVNDQQNSSINIGGQLDGFLKISNQAIQNNSFNLVFNQFYYNDFLAFDSAHFRSEKINSNSEFYSFDIHHLDFKKKRVNFITADILFKSKLNQIILLNSQITYKDQHFYNPLTLVYDINQSSLMLDAVLKDAAIDLLSIPFPIISSISNAGYFQFKLEGPLADLEISSMNILFEGFELSFDPDVSFLDSTIYIDQFDYESDSGQIVFDNLLLAWKGADTFRRVTREEKRNEFQLSGTVSLLFMDLMDRYQLGVDYNLSLPYSFFSINFPKSFVGDVIAKDVQFKGEQTYELSKEGRDQVKAMLGTEEEYGPLLSGAITFRDGIFNLPKMSRKKRKPRISLAMTAQLGAGNFIQGGLFGDGVYNLASNLSLEIDERVSDQLFDIKGTINAPQFSASIPFFTGSVAIFDEAYELLSRDQQSHYFKETPEFISDQYVRIDPVISDKKRGLKTTIHLRALRKNDLIVSTENIRNTQLPYQAVGLSVDGDFQNRIPNITVFDYSIDNAFTLYPQLELYGTYLIELDDQSNFSETSYYGLSLLLPDVITNTDDVTFTNYGRQRINMYVKSSIRPYERRLAKRIGLYDLRVTYDFGKTILNYESDSFQEEDLLGVQFVSDLYKEKMFLTIRTDLNLSSDYSSESAKGVKVTQVDLTYYFLPNFNVGLKNVNEYSEVTTFDPRWSLNYGYSF